MAGRSGIGLAVIASSRFETWSIIVNSQVTIFAGLGFVLTGQLCACSDKQYQERTAEKRSGWSKPGQTDWLAMTDDVSPENWFAGREEKVGVALSSENANELRGTLADASARFKESPRMVVDHAARLEDMPRAESGDETALWLITTLPDTVAPGRVESFGAAARQYDNMRKAGLIGRQALDELSKRYGSRS